MNNKANDSKYLLKSLNKALKVIDIMSVREPLKLSEICDLSGLDKTTAFKILYTLERRNYITKTNNCRYTVGDKITSHNTIVIKRKNIVDIAKPIIDELVKDIGETVSLSTLNANGRTINIYSSDGTNPRHIPARIGLELDAYSTSPGKVLLSYASEDFVDLLIKKTEFKVFTKATLSPVSLRDVLVQVRKDESCMDRDERYMGRSSIAAPIFDSDHSCIAAIGMVCFTSLFDIKKEEFKSKIIKAAKTISRLMSDTF